MVSYDILNIMKQIAWEAALTMVNEEMSILKREWKLIEERVLAKAEEVAREQRIGDEIREKRKVEMARDPDH